MDTAPGEFLGKSKRVTNFRGQRQVGVNRVGGSVENTGWFGGDCPVDDISKPLNGCQREKMVVKERTSFALAQGVGHFVPDVSFGKLVLAVGEIDAQNSGF